MRVRGALKTGIARLRGRLGAEDGFTIIIALGVLVVTSLLAAAAYAAVQADAPLAQRDLEGKRAYYAARAGVNAFLYQLNQNPNVWQTCPSQDTKTPIAPGSNESYTYKPVPANGYSACDPETRSDGSHGNPIGTLIDDQTGTFRMQFTGYAGNPEVSRGLIASFRKDTPLDYLWYTIYETLDPATYPTPWKNDYSQCAAWERSGPTSGAPGYDRPNYCSDINWITGDRLNGPAYTQDQYLINGAPIMGRSNTNDKIESTVPDTNPNAICMHYPAAGACGSADFRGAKAPNADVITPPPDNAQLKVDAQRFGVVYTGVTTVQLNGNQATVTNSDQCPSGCTINIGTAASGRTPIIYVDNQATGCSSNTYSPYNVSYPSTGPCGNVYVSGSYSESLTIAAKGDIVINGNVNKQSTAPVPVLGLVANNFVRVMHGLVGTRPSGADQGDCPSGNGNTEAAGQTLKDVQIDAAILAIKHSFIVDNYDCGKASNVGDLNVKGAIAQIYRGTVGTFGNANTGYLKNYNYDDRFAVAQPPYLFDIASSSWHIARETLCVPNGTAASTKCG